VPDHLGRLGPYEVVDRVGQGAMGVVYKAQDAALNRYVAIKALAPQWASDQAARRRFTREAQAAAAVTHPHVITIYAVGQWRGRPFLVMEFVTGLSLQQRIDERGPLELKELLRIGVQVASGLAAAHAQGLIHRDIKPSNIVRSNTHGDAGRPASPRSAATWRGGPAPGGSRSRCCCWRWPPAPRPGPGGPCRSRPPGPTRRCDCPTGSRRLGNTAATSAAADWLYLRAVDGWDHYASMARMLRADHAEPQLRVAWGEKGDGRPRSPAARDRTGLKAGRFRIARAGSTVHYLVAAKDSDAFRDVAQNEFGTGDHGTVPLMALVNGSGAALDVLWTDLTTRAEVLPGFTDGRHSEPQRASWWLLLAGLSGVTALGIGAWWIGARRAAMTPASTKARVR